MRKRSNFLVLSFFSLTFFQTGFAQPERSTHENSIFWEVTGKNLKTPSYLFGTFHLLDNHYVDSLKNVMSKYHESKTVVSELLMDSTLMMKVMLAGQLKETSLDKLLSAEVYEKTKVWLKKLTGYNLQMFNSLSPVTIQILLMSSLQKIYYPSDPEVDIPMDLYFQSLAKKENKKLVGLETLDVQLHAMFGQFSYERQAELLTQYVNNQDKGFTEVVELNELYRSGNLEKLEAMMTDQQYTKQETEVMVDNRNKKWMEQLPLLMKVQTTFVAVGALHLSGENGLVNLLRKLGYIVKPLQLK
jgi:uncharacterized protein YbaP (TraB family)